MSATGPSRLTYAITVAYDDRAEREDWPYPVIEVVAMSGMALVGVGVLGVLMLIGAAGFLFDLLRRRQSPVRHDEAVQRRANQTLRYYRDVGDSTNSGT